MWASQPFSIESPAREMHWWMTSRGLPVTVIIGMQAGTILSLRLWIPGDLPMGLHSRMEFAIRLNRQLMMPM